MFTTNQEFFPTPYNVIQLMWNKIKHNHPKYILEPSAGKGDIVQFIHDKDRRIKIDVIEQDNSLISILNDKPCSVVGFDFLTYDGVSYYDSIMMNPPFSNGDEHLLYAWNFLHSGDIVCLLNAETIDNAYSEKRKLLKSIIEQHGTVEYLGDCFSSAERKTGVNVVLVHLTKQNKDDSLDLWGVSSQEKEHNTKITSENYLTVQDSLGNMQHFFDKGNEHMIEAFKHIRKAMTYMNANGIDIYGQDMESIFNLAQKNINEAKAEFVQLHRNKAWHKVFSRMEFHKWLDKKQREDFIRQIDKNGNIPFTKENIKGTLQNVFFERDNLFKKSVANVFDELTRYHAENTTYTEGWKSNSNYKINPKIVFPYGCSYDSKYMNRFEMNWGSRNMDVYNDIDRILCNIDGQDFEHCDTIYKSLRNKFDELGSNPAREDYADGCESDYFHIKFFKKGTIHLTFKSKELMNKMNILASEGKMWIGKDA